MSKQKLGHLILAALIILVLITNWQNGLWMLNVKTVNANWEIMAIILGSLFFLLNLVAAIGLLRTRPWGYYLTYIAVIFSTVMLSTSYIPFIGRLGQFLPAPWEVVPFVVGNLIFLGFTFYLQRLARKTPS
jgi:hypothetical protein